MSKEKKLVGVIDRLEEKKAVLKFDDGQTLNIDINFLPENSGEGSVVEIKIEEPGGRATEERAKQAKAILNEILKKD
ncbi:MAG: hypothetical protein UT86_C0002G0070 [Candidatus Magasanikbacteria bacterium GW2011_GWC2_40_17]|uniref:DUF3006 domain-containing protein n=1 Tax=Candidatus Magasanikbacteria bacterium GW2011_GWA2_42_32 TaxID=1619039 RepID=A0A0G1CF80_9BACT|nr:MAG: hypothetical protein UT86_C0002G0070 [Candidatus Magasanikbacteria bacterium GW2011_GWC2_40_17]KKS57231.1 MAG: hypothetical protein UV20_C0002G0020 [Candidatus Magasanikbacteria bacterium GW2011_GWA2_42_32]OGH86124.1 MAG: hypothetical protein A2294_02595 [Candidatus Magasanikbacteria bacterium RIFOXYB2_FULL_38_10]